MAITLDGTSGITTPGLTNTGTETIVNLTTTGNTILGDASTDTLNVGNGGLVKDASGNVGIGTASPYTKLDVNGVITVEPIASGGKPQILLGSGGASYGQIQNDANGLWSLGYGGTSTALGTPVLKWDTSGNLGLGVTPSAWQVNWKVFQFGSGSLLSSATGGSNTILTGNAYLNSSGNYTYVYTNYATAYTQNAGQHYWAAAPSGTAGNAITFANTMTLDASGNLSTSKSVNAINSATITKVSNFGVETPFIPGASKTFTLGCSNTLIFLIANNSSGASAFGYVSYNSGTVTFMAGSDASFVNSSSPTANQLGIYKSANSGSISFKTGSNYSSGITITVLGGALTVTDPA